jgi:hypothetical protein
MEKTQGAHLLWLGLLTAAAIGVAYGYGAQRGLF